MKLELWTRSGEGFLTHLRVELTALQMLTVHGNLCLALRHPENLGSSRRFCIEAVHALEKVLQEEGVLDEEDIRKIRTDSPETRQCRVCGCIDTEACADPHHGGEPCYWVGYDLCSACAPAGGV